MFRAHETKHGVNIKDNPYLTIVRQSLMTVKDKWEQGFEFIGKRRAV
jgi:hypothetical protein